MDEWLALLNLKICISDEGADTFDKFYALQTYEERIRFVLKLILKHSVIPQPCPETKNAEKSIELREQGNKKYMSKPLTNSVCIDALKLYTKSIAYAPYSSEQLALAYANRSAVLKKVHKYEECIQDIDRALALSYPNNLRNKLYLRKIECLSILKHPKTEDTVKEAQCWLKEMCLDDVGYKKMNNMFISAKKISASNIPKKQSITKQSPLPKLQTHNPKIPCASDAITIKYNTEYGRNIVATRDINVGEVIVVEKPYSLMLDLDNLQTHCSNCLEVSWANIPCNYCIYAMYCSEECKASDWKKYHDMECKIFPYLIKLDFTRIFLFNIRLAIHAIRESGSIQNLREELKEVESCDDPLTKGFSKNGIFESNSHRSVISLVTNIEKLSLPNLFRRFVEHNIGLYYLATCTDIIGSSIKDFSELIENDDAVFVGELMARHQLIISSNGHSFTELRGTDVFDRGVALLPFLSLMNHSCNPNILRISKSTHVVVRTILPIKKDEQIFDAYGEMFAMVPKFMRQKELQKLYYFTCHCVPCEENWPLYHELESFINIKNVVQNEDNVHSLLNVTKYFDMVKKEDVLHENMIDDVLKALQILYDKVKMPHRIIPEVLEVLRHIYSLSGNKFYTPEL